MDKARSDKLQELERLIAGYGTVALGFSGGVDSTFLAAVCARCIPGRATLVHLDSPFQTTRERSLVAQTADRLGLPLHRIALDPLSDPLIAANPPDRCYHCKRRGFSLIFEHARELGIETVLEGSNADDLLDDRPGMRAVKELGARSPLAQAGWRKDEERELLRAWGLPCWNLPAGACLATRVSHGTPLTPGRLRLAGAVEDALANNGLQQVRCRMDRRSAHVELGRADLDALRRAGCREQGGSVALSREMLPADLGRLMAGAGIGRLDELARPYRKGAQASTPPM